MDGSKQGDSSVRYIFSLLGVKTAFATRKSGVPTTVRLTKSGHRVQRLEYNFVNAPDLAQTFVCTCCAMGVPFHFTGLQTLKIKETDRIKALKTELGKLGYMLENLNDSELRWDGTKPQTSILNPQTSIDPTMTTAWRWPSPLWPLPTPSASTIRRWCRSRIPATGMTSQPQGLK